MSRVWRDEKDLQDRYFSSWRDEGGKRGIRMDCAAKGVSRITWSALFIRVEDMKGSLVEETPWVLNSCQSHFCNKTYEDRAQKSTLNSSR